MKKIIFSIMVLFIVTVAYAQKLPYKIFVETYSNTKDPQIRATYDELKKALSNFEEANVVDRTSDQYRVIVVETIMEKDRLNELLSTIKKMPGHSDAFVLPAPELLEKNQYNPPATTNEQTVTPNEQNNLEENALPQVDSTNELTTSPEIKMQDEEEIPENPFSLSQAIDSVLKSNPNIKERIYNYMETGKDLDIADKGYYPTLDLAGSITYGQDKASEGSKNGEDDDWHDNFTKQAELRLVQNLFNGGSTQNNIEQAQSRMKNASYLLLERADRLTLETVSAYLTLIKEKDLLELAEENVKTHEEIYRQIKERAESGFGRVSEEQQAGSRLTLAQSNYISQQNAYDDALSTLEKLTNMSVDTNSLVYPEFIASLPKSREEIKQKAMLCNPSIRAEMANVTLAQTIYQGADAAFLPQIDFEAFASIRDTDNYSYDDQRIDSYGALLRLSYNLFNKGIDTATKEKRQIAFQKEQQVLDATKQDLEESLRFSWQSYVLKDKKLEYLRDHAKFSYDTVESYKEEFKIGRRDLINVLDAENEYYSARREIASTKRDYIYAKYRLLDNMGLITDNFNPGFGKKYVKDACSIEENLQ